MIALGIILAILVLTMLIPVGIDGEYIAGNYKLSAKISFYHLQILPKKPQNPKKEKKAKKQPDTAEASGQEPKKQKKKLSLSFNREEIFSLIKHALKAVGKFGGHVNVDRFLLHYTAAGKDPYDTAQTFGYVNAALSSLAPICAKRYRVKDCDVWTRIDFLEEKMSLNFALALSIRVGQVMSVAVVLLYRSAIIFIKNKLRLRKESRQLIKNMNTQEGLN